MTLAHTLIPKAPPLEVDENGVVRVGQTRLTLVRDLRVRGVDPGLGQVRLPLFDGLLERCRIELREELSLLHVTVEIGEEVRDQARYLAADLNGRDRRQGAGRGDRHGDRAPIHPLGFVLIVLLARRARQHQAGDQ